MVQLDHFLMSPRLTHESSRVRVPGVFGIDHSLGLLEEVPTHIKYASCPEELSIHGRGASQGPACGVVVCSAQKKHVYAEVHPRIGNHRVKRLNPGFTSVLLREYLPKTSLEVVGLGHLQGDVLPELEDQKRENRARIQVKRE